MQTVGLTQAHWRGRRVFVTGHTGFFGGWLCHWLCRLGAEVTGYALAPATEPSFYGAAALDRRVRPVIADIRDLDRLRAALASARPATVFHLAAQPLVRVAHAEPAETFEVNLMGTVNLMQALRNAASLEAAVVVTTDKVYDNREWDWGYRETDALGGHEPYGASKAAAELAVEAFRRSYLGEAGIATARAGNIIGGGDWAADRLVPDAMKAFANGGPLRIRNPRAIRPWQHVLEASRGLLLLAERLAGDPAAWSGPWNFGPAEDDARSVAEVADGLAALWGGGASWIDASEGGAPYEARLLSLNSTKARIRMNWRPLWPLERALAATVDWYRAHGAGREMAAFTESQIAAYEGAN